MKKLKAWIIEYWIVLAFSLGKLVGRVENPYFREQGAI